MKRQIMYPGIRAWLAERGMSISEFADDINIPYNTVKAKMSGKTSWKLEEIRSVLDATGGTFEEMFR